MKRGSDDGQDPFDADDDGNVALCASCDRCRARKTKCDGRHPCNNCAAKYMKKNKTGSVDGVDISEFECVYSPAKRRGPVPGRVGTSKKGSEMMAPRAPLPAVGGMDSMAAAVMQHQAAMNTGQLDASRMMMFQQQASLGAMPGYGGGMDHYGSQVNLQMDPLATMMQQMQGSMAVSEQARADISIDQPSARRFRTEVDDAPTAPDTVAAHSHLNNKDSSDGNRLRAYYRLSVDELFGLPAIPFDEANLPMLSHSHQVALQAAQFSELALGALVHNEVSLAMELCNATVHCLRESVKEPVQSNYVFEIGRAYFLLGVFRAFRGDMDRYFKYRRVALTHMAQIGDGSGSEQLLAAMAYLDSWAYMMFNANEKKLPSIDGVIPQVSGCGAARRPTSDIEVQYNTSCNSASIAADPKNQMWIQGVPPVYLNNEAPLPARALDALACAIRRCCDQANSRFSMISQEAEPGVDSSDEIPIDSIMTPTTTAVLAHENELCSRNMVLSAFTLLQQYEAQSGGSMKYQGHHLVISAMDAFLENGDEDGSGGFTDSQIQSLLSVCNNAIENPLLLHHGGPTYHLVSNAAILLSHLLNGMYSQGMQGPSREMEAAVFEEILDTFLSVRKLLNIHRRKLPVKLRCHGIPRPSLDGRKDGQAFIDLGDTLMCGCRGCQGFVLMACSPCVAAERARTASANREKEAVQEQRGMQEAGELDQAFDDFGLEFDLDDDALLNMLSRIIST